MLISKKRWFVHTTSAGLTQLRLNQLRRKKTGGNFYSLLSIYWALAVVPSCNSNPPVRLSPFSVLHAEASEVKCVHQALWGPQVRWNLGVILSQNPHLLPHSMPAPSAKFTSHFQSNAIFFHVIHLEVSFKNTYGIFWQTPYRTEEEMTEENSIWEAF